MFRNRRMLFVVGIIIAAALLIGYVALSDSGSDSDRFEVGVFVMDHMVEAMEGFQEDMTRRGFVDGENITYRVWMFEQEALPGADTIAELDILMALEAGDNEEEPLGRAFELANNKVPIVFMADNTFPLEGGYVESLAHPGKNVTGVMQTSADGRRFELFVEMLPDARRILVPYNDAEPDAIDAIEDLNRLAEAFNVELVLLPMEEANAYFAENSVDVDAIFNLKAHDIIVDLIAYSQAHQLPVSDDGTNVEVLGIEGDDYYLMLYLEDEASMSVQAASIAEQILNGADPAEVRVENASSLLTVNLAVANRFGIEIPDSILEQANQIIRPQGNAE